MRRGLLGILLAVLTACHADSIYYGVDSPTVEFAHHAWRLGTLRFRSDAFAYDQPWRIRIAGSLPPTVGIDATTLEVTLPDTTGTFEVFAEDGVRSHPIGSLTLHGGLVANRLVPSLDGTAMAWPYGTGTLLYGHRGRLVKVDVSTATETSVFPDLHYTRYCGAGPWPAGGNDVVIAGEVGGWDAGGFPVACRARAAAPSGAVLDSFPGGDAGFFYPTLRLGAGAWLNNSAESGTRLWSLGADGSWRSTWSAVLGEVWRVVAPPDGSAAFGVEARALDASLGIFHADRLEAPVLLPFVALSVAAAFSPSGDTLAVADWNDTLHIVESHTGAVVARALWQGAQGDLAFDYERPFLYAARPDSHRTGVVVTVYEVPSMRVLTVLRARGRAPAEGYAYVYLAVDVWRRRLNVLLSDTQPRSGVAAGFSFELTP